ncbi:MAG: cytochrome ubiquinol oxidase subunit I [candidate division Zixibacteria bacterium]|nr:cytochrome ubiquinol oxidase subunit I [candidate division Zixibacteria bacterium]
MNYPSWTIEGLGSGWLIGLIAITHVFISHFAVGAGIFVPVTEYFARKHNRQDVLDFLHHHTRFFLILTAVFGASSGVGIWFSISLVQPAATASLIRTFVFAWGIEWMVFLVEVTSLIFYYYGWNKMKPELHQKIGWIYAVTAYCSLVIINGILTFMLTPGAWIENRSFWSGFFNPSYFPSLLLRTTVTFALAGLWGIYQASRLDRDHPLRTWMLRYSSRWLIPSYLVSGVFLFWYIQVIPGESLTAMTQGITGAGAGNLSILTRVAMLVGLLTLTIAFMVLFGPYLNPTDFTAKKAIWLLVSGFIVTGAAEWSREVLRKPYAIRGFMFSNGLLAQEADEKLKQPFFEHARWARLHGDVGSAMFKTQCSSCHTLNGYRALTGYLKGRDQESIYNFLTILQKGEENPYRFIMPPVLGSDDDLKALASFLEKEVKAVETPETAAK